MPRATMCHLDARMITITEAIELRDSARSNGCQKQEYLCIECGKPVTPHKKSIYGEAHFEHHARNPGCKWSDPVR